MSEARANLIWIFVCFLPACGSSQSEAACAESGRAPLDNTCVSQQVADFVMCIRNRGTVSLKSDRGQSLTLEAGIAGQKASSAVELKNELDARYETKPDAEAERHVIDQCATIVGAISATPKGSSTNSGPPSPTTPENNASKLESNENIVFSERFQGVEEGLAPANWIVDDGIGVVNQGRSKCLGMLQTGNHKVRTPPISWPSDFRVEVDAQMYESGYTNQFVQIAVPGIASLFGGGYSGDGGQLTNAANAESSMYGTGAFGKYIGKRATIVLEKKGPVLRSLVDDNPFLLSRKSNIAPLGAVPLTVEFTAHSMRTFCIHRVSVFRL